MDISIFQRVTTESALLQLEAEGAKYDGLYVDMSNAPERKYVKEKAAEIQGIIKKVNAFRIAEKKAYGLKVEDEAARIISRLSDANSNFQVLIDDWNAERKAILDAEKARKAEIEAAIKMESDHEFALLMNAKFDSDKLKAEAEKKEHDERIKKEAIKAQAEQAERDRITAQQELERAEERRIADVQQAKSDERAAAKRLLEEQAAAEKARLENIEHVRAINNQVLDDLLDHTTLPVEQLKMIVRAIARKEIPNLTINY